MTDRWWMADPTIWGRLMATDHEIVEAMLKYGGSFVFSLAQCYRRADADNKAILKAAFPHVWAEYAELITKPEPPRCPRCGSYSWTYQADKQVCSDCGK